MAPSDDTVTGGGHVAMPDSASAHMKVTVTGVRFQPAAFGSGDTVADIVGADLSTLTEIVAVARLPALSTAVPEKL